jgi:hypothetical protein
MERLKRHNVHSYQITVFWVALNFTFFTTLKLAVLYKE